MPSVVKDNPLVREKKMKMFTERQTDAGQKVNRKALLRVELS